MSTFSHPTSKSGGLQGHRGSQQVLSFGKTATITPYMDLIDDFSDENQNQVNSHVSSSIFNQQTLQWPQRPQVQMHGTCHNSRSRVMSQDDLHQQSRQSFYMSQQPNKQAIYDTI